MYGTAFLVTDLLNEKYGKEEAKKAVWLGFFTLLSMTIIMQMVLMFKPHEKALFYYFLGSCSPFIFPSPFHHKNFYLFQNNRLIL